jgi:hypothetical protein
LRIRGAVVSSQDTVNAVVIRLLLPLPCGPAGSPAMPRRAAPRPARPAVPTEYAVAPTGRRTPSNTSVAGIRGIAAAWCRPTRRGQAHSSTGAVVHIGRVSLSSLSSTAGGCSCLSNSGIAAWVIAGLAQSYSLPCATIASDASPALARHRPGWNGRVLREEGVGLSMRRGPLSLLFVVGVLMAFLGAVVFKEQAGALWILGTLVALAALVLSRRRPPAVHQAGERD